MWKAAEQSAFRKFALQRVPGKGETETEVLGSWAHVELCDFPADAPAFSLPPESILARGQRALRTPGDHPPPCASATALLVVPSPGGTLPHRANRPPGRGNHCSSRCPPTAKVRRAGWRGWGARRKGSGSSVQEVVLAANLVGRLLGQRRFIPTDAWAGQVSAAVPWPRFTHVLPLTLMFSAPVVPTSKSPQTGLCSRHSRMMMAQGSDA